MKERKKMITVGKVLLIVALFTLIGCEPSTKDVSTSYVMPDALKNCNVFEMSGRERLYVVVCPETISTNWETSRKDVKNNVYVKHSVTVKNAGGDK